MIKFKFHAPALLEYEVAKFIHTTDKRINKNKLSEGWMKLRNILKIGTQVSAKAFNLANMIIGNRDPKDIPFVAMYIDLGASNILTYDKDFNHHLLQPLNIDGVGSVVAGVYRGLLSFFVLSDLTPGTLNFFGQLMLGLIKILFDTVKLLVDLFSAAIRNAMDETAKLLSKFFPETREWIESGTMNAALLAIAVFVAGVSIIDTDIRNNLSRLTNFIIKLLQPITERIVNWLDNSIRSLVDCVKTLLPHIIAVLGTLLVNLSTVISHVKLMPSQFVG